MKTWTHITVEDARRIRAAPSAGLGAAVEADPHRLTLLAAPDRDRVLAGSTDALRAYWERVQANRTAMGGLMTPAELALACGFTDHGEGLE